MTCVFECFQSHCHILKELHDFLCMMGAITIFGKNSFRFRFVDYGQMTKSLEAQCTFEKVAEKTKCRKMNVNFLQPNQDQSSHQIFQQAKSLEAIILYNDSQHNIPALQVKANKMELMNFHSPFPAFSYATCKCHVNILSCVHQHRGCGKSSKASAKAGGSWLEKCGSRNQKPGLWPVLKQWVGGLSSCSPSMVAILISSPLEIQEFLSQQICCFVHVSCIQTVSPQNMAILGGKKFHKCHWQNLHMILF